MHLRLLPSAFQRIPAADNLSPSQPLTTFQLRSDRVPGMLAIDGGSLGMVGEPEDMVKYSNVLLTHAHIDHVATLPMWIEALLSQGRAPVPVHGTRETIEALRTHFFNDVIFPNFERLTDGEGRQLMQFIEVTRGQKFPLAGFEAFGFAVQHPVPTTGYWISDGQDAVLFGADSGPTERLWAIAAELRDIRAIVLETSFPDRMGHVAESSGHLTPALLKAELKKAPEDVRILISHMKPAYRGEIIRAIEELDDPRVELMLPGVDLEIGG